MGHRSACSRWLKRKGLDSANSTDKLLANLENDQVWAKPTKVRWKCRVCGHIHEGEKAPAKCPVCDTERNDFEIAAENY